MKQTVFNIRGYVALPIAALAWALLSESGKRLARADRRQWCRWKHLADGLAGFSHLFANYPEFRTVFYHRMGRLRILFSWWLRPLRDLYINTRQIGGGLLIQHGFSTIISARSIGENCKIYHHVTLGYNHRLECPTLGNNVEVCCGAKVLGGVTVGDNVLIGAGAAVTNDVPPNCVVAGVPARIIRRLNSPRDLTL